MFLRFFHYIYRNHKAFDCYVKGTSDFILNKQVLISDSLPTTMVVSLPKKDHVVSSFGIKCGGIAQKQYQTCLPIIDYAPITKLITDIPPSNYKHDVQCACIYI